MMIKVLMVMVVFGVVMATLMTVALLVKVAEKTRLITVCTAVVKKVRSSYKLDRIPDCRSRGRWFDLTCIRFETLELLFTPLCIFRKGRERNPTLL